MQKQTYSSQVWWHERPVKMTELHGGYHRLAGGHSAGTRVWQNAALMVGLMFAFVLSLIFLAAR